jgi:hypothetical protein
VVILAVNKEGWGVEVELNKTIAKKVWATSNRFSLRILIFTGDEVKSSLIG